MRKIVSVQNNTTRTIFGDIDDLFVDSFDELLSVVVYNSPKMYQQ